MEQLYIEDVAEHKDPRKTTKPRVDETRGSQRQVTSERITVTRTDGTKTEEIRRTGHPKDHALDRIVIEEIPEKKEKEPQVHRKYDGKPRTTEVTVRRDDVKDVCKPYQKEDLIKVGKLDVHGLEKAPEESRRLEERLLTQTERLPHHQKAR